MIKYLAAVALLFAVAGCTTAQRQEACILDRAGQPIFIPLESVASAVEPIAALPLMVLHNGVQMACSMVK